MQASCMQAGTLGTVPSVESRRAPQSQGQPRPESQLWQGRRAPPRLQPQPSDGQSCSLLTHTHTCSHTQVLCVPMYGHAVELCMHQSPDLHTHLPCRAQELSACAHTPHTHKRTSPWYRYPLPAHTQSTSAASHTCALHTARQPSSYLAGDALGWSSPNSSSLKRLLKRTERGRPVLSSASSCRDTHG